MIIPKLLNPSYKLNFANSTPISFTSVLSFILTANPVNYYLFFVKDNLNLDCISI